MEQTIDFGIFTRPDGETIGRLVLDVTPNGTFTLSHMRTPDDGTIVASGEFREYIKGLPAAALSHLARLNAIP